MSSRVALSALCLAASAAVLAPSCLERRDDFPRDEATPCADCHGDPSRDGDALQKAAPPVDLQGASDPSYPGVGAHQRHLQGSDRHAPVPCTECHIVPETTEAPGHADDAAPAEVVFGPLARGGEGPEYDPRARACSDTYCHGSARPVWTRPRPPAETCGTCHALPPPAPHPASDRCATCHGSVVDADQAIIAPALHVDGQVQVEPASCTACHGSGDDPAPPVDTRAGEARSAIGVGAHQAHLAGGTSSRPLACAECHVVPTRDGAAPDASGADDGPSHIDGLPAEVRFSGVALNGGRMPSWDRGAVTCSDTWCHSAGAGEPSPPWTSTTGLGCADCHGAPPPPPHPVMDDCSLCHGQVLADDDRTVRARDLHVDGTVQVDVPPACNACHGDESPAPPPDLAGSSDTSLASVGAHQTHLAGTASSRAVPCSECHLVPDATLTGGHIDTPRPAEVVFSGVATSMGSSPVYDGQTCSGTPCHGDAFAERHDSAGTNTTPDWTAVGQGQASCGTCHQLPPGRPHPLADLNPVCSACHENIADDNRTFTRPDLHVDGTVTFEVP